MSKAFALINEGIELLADNDPLNDRNAKVRRQIENAHLPYNDLYNKKKEKSKQTSITNYITSSLPNTIKLSLQEITHTNLISTGKKQTSLKAYLSGANVNQHKKDHLQL